MADFSLKYTKFVVGWGSAPDPAGGAYSAPPDSLARSKGSPQTPLGELTALPQIP